MTSTKYCSYLDKHKNYFNRKAVNFNPCIQKGYVIITRNSRKFGAQMKTDAPHDIIDNQTKD